MEQTHTLKSVKLLDELADAKIINGKYDKTKAQLIVRRYLCDVFAEAVELSHMAHNKPNYLPPNKKRIMKPIEFKEQNCIYAKDQPEYMPLPASGTGAGLKKQWSLTYRKLPQYFLRIKTTK